MRRLTPKSAALTALLLVQPLALAQRPATTPPPAPAGSHTFDTDTGQRIKVTEVVGGLVHPYSLAFPDARTMLVAERAGRLRIVKDGAMLPKPAWEAGTTRRVAAAQQPARRVALHRVASRICHQPAGVPHLPEVRPTWEHDRGGPGEADW